MWMCEYPCGVLIASSLFQGANAGPEASFSCGETADLFPYWLHKSKCLVEVNKTSLSPTSLPAFVYVWTLLSEVLEQFQSRK